MSRPSVLVLGDVFLDEYIDGEATRIAPEAPVPVVLQKRVSRFCGGAANVAANIAGLGHRVYLLGTVGPDPPGGPADTLRGLLSEHNVCHNLRVDPQATTIVKTRVSAGGKQIVRVDAESSLPSQHGVAASLFAALRTLFETQVNIGLIVVADYAKGGVPDDLPRLLVDLCRSRNIPLFVDTKPKRIDFYKGATLVKPNYPEMVAILEAAGTVHPALAAGHRESVAEVGIKHLVEKHGVSAVVVTMGADGSVAYGGGKPFVTPAKAQEVFDVAGAGDTFMAALAAAFLDGRPFPEAVLRANIAGGLAVSRPGITVVTTDALEHAIAADAGPAGKQLSVASAAMWAARQATTKQIVFTNGCFDLLHHGHLSLLRYAKSMGDLLVVAYNSDASVRSLKGETRPLVPGGARGDFLSFVPEVDVVVEFDGDVEALVRKLKPTVLVKGAEYRNKAVPGADYVAGRGGRVEFAPMVPDVHTSLNAAKLLTSH